ncbi:MAG: LysR family transcriptional regulator [Acetobacteraceae bacterium]|nr:LysR family transcriptional regulator [Acetobacteraceae bacterium]
MNPAALDLNLLRVFDAVMRERHVTRAAARLGLTQSAVSNGLARLRRAFGDELFVRRPGGVEPTALANDLDPRIAAALDEVQAALALKLPFVPASATEHFSIGMSEYAEAVLAAPLVAALAAEAPGCTLTIRHVDRTDAAALLECQDIAIALAVMTEELPAHFTRILVLPDEFVTLMRPGHALSEGELSLPRFVGFPHLVVSPNGSRRAALDEPLRAAGHPRRVTVTCGHFLAVADILLASDLVCTMSGRMGSRIARAHGLVARPAPVDVRHARLSMAWHRRHEAHPAHVWLRRKLQALAREAPVQSMIASD